MRLAIMGVCGVSLFAACFAGGFNGKRPTYKVLPAITQDNLTVFPVVADRVFDTSQFLSLDEGIRSGKVTVTETGLSTSMLRPRPGNDGIWRLRPLVEGDTGAQVNELALTNNSDRPLLLLAGEIVTGGKQDRVVAKDRIVPAHSQPIALGVFCVEPHRWVGASAGFGATASAMAQPSVRVSAMAEQNQQNVWDEVAKSREAMATAIPGVHALAMRSTSSYAAAVQNPGVQARVDSIAGPIERSYDKFTQRLHDQKAVGVVVAVNGHIIWADVFASPALLETYWTKLVRSYGVEALGVHTSPALTMFPASQANAQAFLDHLYGNQENVETEPGVYRTTEIHGDGFDAFLLTSLLPNTGFEVHIAKMKL